MRYFYDNERGEFLTEADLVAEFEELSAMGETEASTAEEYIENCLRAWTIAITEKQYKVGHSDKVAEATYRLLADNARNNTQSSMWCYDFKMLEECGVIPYKFEDYLKGRDAVLSVEEEWNGNVFVWFDPDKCPNMDKEETGF